MTPLTLVRIPMAFLVQTLGQPKTPPATSVITLPRADTLPICNERQQSTIKGLSWLGLSSRMHKYHLVSWDTRIIEEFKTGSSVKASEGVNSSAEASSHWVDAGPSELTKEISHMEQGEYAEAYEHTESTQYADDVPINIKLRVFILGNTSVEEVYAVLTPVFIPATLVTTTHSYGSPRKPVSYITVPPLPDMPPSVPSPSPSPNPVREDTEHPRPGWLVYVPDDPRMPPVHIPTGHGGYKPAHYIHYVIDQFNKPISMGTQG
ncbi:hypothetical protein EDB85DRAFT_1888292 [Lactarius pseudohatsudake]|nr:hypothetical protein EDB85DRAFT_1888292 [Lactarius pseudohatsudake]